MSTVQLYNFSHVIMLRSHDLHDREAWDRAATPHLIRRRPLRWAAPSESFVSAVAAAPAARLSAVRTWASGPVSRLCWAGRTAAQCASSVCSCPSGCSWRTNQLRSSGRWNAVRTVCLVCSWFVRLFLCCVSLVIFVYSFAFLRSCVVRPLVRSFVFAWFVCFLYVSVFVCFFGCFCWFPCTSTGSSVSLFAFLVCFFDSFS